MASDSAGGYRHSVGALPDFLWGDQINPFHSCHDDENTGKQGEMHSYLITSI